MQKRVAVLVAAILVVTGACTSAGGPSPSSTSGSGQVELVSAHVPRTSAEPEAATTSAASVTAFGLDLYRRIAAKEGNLVVSPASIALALAMARAGARGETAAEMDDVLRVTDWTAQLAGLNALDAALSSRSGTFAGPDGRQLELALRIANAPFAQRDMPIEDAYLEAPASAFGAGLRVVDYGADPEGARRLINDWVSAQTEKRIPELLQAGTISELTRLTLVNAVYLKAPWKTAFDAEETTDGAFTRPDGSTVEVPLMAQTEFLSYADAEGAALGRWRAVDLPYYGGTLALTVVVPDDLATFEANLTGTSFDAIVAALRPREVTLAFPKFGIETRAELADVLVDMGMPRAFDPARADFSGITDAEALFIARVVHQANIDVDEAGTEAAAATAVVMDAAAAPADEPVTMRVDRPFLFAIRDTGTGAVLFLGRVVDPAAGK